MTESTGGYRTQVKARSGRSTETVRELLKE